MTSKQNQVSIKDWILKGLTECLQFEPPVEVVNHVMLAETEEALRDFLQNLLDMNRPVCQRFINDIARLRNLPREKKGANFEEVQQHRLNVSKDLQKHSPSKPKQQPAQVISLKEASQLDRVVLPGRRQCQCLAIKHGLVGNCIKCGRIICEQEGPGPCFFCGNIVGDVATGATSLKDVLGQQPEDPGLTAALQHRDKLLEYDKTSAKRTKIYDDQSDYFSVGASVWMDDKERKALIEKQAKIYEARFGPRRHKTIALDFAGRQIVEVAPKNPSLDDEEDDDKGSANDRSNNRMQASSSQPPGFGGASYLQNPMTAADSDYSMPKYVSAVKGELKKSENRAEVENLDFRPLRLQDSEILEMSDRGVCVSVQQPYASLIILGLKRFEGRTWATSHRGRLWIVSSSKPCSQEVISSTEKFYKKLLNDDKLKFPKSYPSGCLLGCIDLVDCLPQDQFREKFPNGECEDLFVWILANPKLLSIQFPVTDRLSGHVHRAAIQSLI